MPTSKHHPALELSHHPLLKHKLTLLRDERCSVRTFRQVMRECGFLLGYEATSKLKLKLVTVETPISKMDDALELEGPPPVIIPILRSGLVLAEGLQEILPTSPIGHIGLSRDPEDKSKIVEYYVNIPADVGHQFIVVDPVIATGKTMEHALQVLVSDADVPPANISVLALLVAETGLKRLATSFPSIPIHAAGVDSTLDSAGYLLPGIGDIGNRLFHNAERFERNFDG